MLACLHEEGLGVLRRFLLRLLSRLTILRVVVRLLTRLNSTLLTMFLRLLAKSGRKGPMISLIISTLRSFQLERLSAISNDLIRRGFLRNGLLEGEAI